MLIATPLSHLFRHKKAIAKVVNISNCFECRDASFHSDINRQYLYHSDISIVKNWEENEEIKHLYLIKNFKKDLKLISFHIPSCYSNPIIKNGIFQSNGKKFTKKEMLRNAKDNLKILKEILSNDILIAIENNNYYPSEAYDIITDSSFLLEIVYDNKINFLFDISHAIISSYNKKISYHYYIKNLPLEKCIQVHISRYSIKDGIARDNHNRPDNEIYKLLLDILKDYNNVKYLTIEYYKSIDTLFNIIKEVKNLIKKV
ncbi:MAG: DUF692 family multinuclear iron-containing protein [Candidatus Hydrogenedentota bacterium]